MKMGIGVTGFAYWQADDKTVNLLDPSVVAQPSHADKTITWDTYGWPTSIPKGKFSGWYIPATEGYTKPGRYRLTASGSGHLYFPHTDLPVAKRNFDVKSNGHQSSLLAEWDVVTSDRVLMGIMSTDPTDHLRDVKFYRVGNDPSQMFTPEYIADRAHFDTLRTAGYTGVINSPNVNWPSFPGDPFGMPAKWIAAIGIANKTGCNLWINIPHKASDDYVRQVARLVKAYLRPGLKVYLEYSIEIWNWGYPFGYATHWVEDWGHANLGPNYPYQMSAVELAHHVQDVFAAEAPDVPLVRLFCDQFWNPWLFTAQAMPYADAKKYKFDAIGVAPYVDAPGVDWAVLDHLILSGTESDRQAALDLVFSGYDRGLAQLDQWAVQYKSEADKRGQRLVCYEMGPSWGIASNSPSHRLSFYESTHRDTRMKTFLSERYFPWLAKYFDLAMYTQDCERPAPGKFWGAKGNADDNSNPKWQACLEWCGANNGK